LLRRVVEEVEAEIRQVEKELTEARRIGARAEELAAVRDNLYEDKWFRIATAVFTQLKKDTPKTRRRPKSSRRPRGAYPASGSWWWWRLLC